MTFSYEGSINIIKKYTIENNEIIIEYLDERIEKLPYTKSNEERVLTSMFNQAYERNQMMNSEIKERIIKNASVVCIGDLMVSIFYEISEYGKEHPGYIILPLAVFSFLTCTIISKQQSEYNELKKYKLYLDTFILKEQNNGFDLKSYDKGSHDGFDFELIKENILSFYDIAGLNINNLDEISYKNVKKKILEYKNNQNDIVTK